MSQPMEFETDILWDEQKKLCKLKVMDGKKGKYFLGEFNKMFKIVIHKDTFDKEGKSYNAFLVPIKYTKKEQAQAQATPPPAEEEVPW